MVSLDWNTEILVPDTRTTSFELIVGVDITDITTNKPLPLHLGVSFVFGGFMGWGLVATECFKNIALTGLRLQVSLFFSKSFLSLGLDQVYSHST